MNQTKKETEMRKIIFELENSIRNITGKLSQLTHILYTKDEEPISYPINSSFSFLKLTDEENLKKMIQEPIDYKKVRDDFYHKEIVSLLQKRIIKDETELNEVESRLEESKLPMPKDLYRSYIHNSPELVSGLTKRREDLLLMIKRNKDYHDNLEKSIDLLEKEPGV